MTKSEMKKIMKPLVKECLQEMLLEEGLLSNLISEVNKGNKQEINIPCLFYLPFCSKTA